LQLPFLFSYKYVALAWEALLEAVALAQSSKHVAVLKSSFLTPQLCLLCFLHSSLFSVPQFTHKGGSGVPGSIKATVHRISRWMPIRTLLLLVFAFPSLTACTLPFSGTRPSASGPLVVQQPPAARQLYVAIGASDTYGIGTDDPRTQSWPADLSNQFGQETRLVNLGIPAIDAHAALNIELPVALDAHPNLVTVWLAVNDLADNVPLTSYEQDLDRLLNRLHTALPNARIAVANVPDLSYLPHFQGENHQLLEQQIQAYNTVIAKVVVRNQVILVDLYRLANEMATHPEYISDDGFHPNALGYAVLAQIFYQVLQKSSS
jgi:lysophospholipase L1-like esterase